MKKTVNFRFSERVIEALEWISRETENTRTQIIEGLVLDDFDRRRGQPSSAKQIAEGVVSSKPVHSARALAESTPRVTKPIQPACMPPAPPLPNPNTVLSREEREARVDAMQRKMAKGKK